MGIDNGTQGLSIIFVEESTMNVLAMGEADYGMVPNLETGCYEQRAEDWESAMKSAMNQLHNQMTSMEVLAIGISGQMHGEVLQDATGNVIGSVRLWCDARNEAEGIELTNLFQHKIPKRMTSARFLWTIRHQLERAQQTEHITTPAGWMSYRLTGEHTLGIGDASGIFPIDQETMTYDKDLIAKFDDLVQTSSAKKMPSIEGILPRVCVAGEPAGYLHAEGARLLGLAEGIPVAPAEGDQPAALAGSYIGKAGTVSLSFGTSVCANSVGDRQFKGVSPLVDQLCGADGKPINMVWLRNGTTFMNTVVASYGGVLPADNTSDQKSGAFAAVMPQLVEAEADCGGLLALPFMDDEPGLQVSKGGSAMIMGWNHTNSSPGNVAKAALLSTCFNLRKGSAVLDEQGYPRTELVLTGGLAKTPECGQILADTFDTPVTLLGSSDEGSCFGASLMAAFLYKKLNNKLTNNEQDWASFLESTQKSGSKTRYKPIPENVAITNAMYARYNHLLKLVPQLSEI